MKKVECKACNDNASLYFLMYMLPKYRQIENTFERGLCYHGRTHIIRVWLFASAMSNFLLEQGVQHDRFAVLCAAAGHDVGRKGGGDDLWEEDSARITINTIQTVLGDEFFETSRNSIIKNCITHSSSETIESMLVGAADSLDIARVKNFDPRKFVFGKGHNFGFSDISKIRSQLVAESENLIRMTYPHHRYKAAKNNNAAYDELMRITQQAIADMYVENECSDISLFDKIVKIIRCNSAFKFLDKYAFAYDGNAGIENKLY